MQPNTDGELYRCEFCPLIGDARKIQPVGPDHKQICHDCAMKPEYKDVVRKHAEEMTAELARTLHAEVTPEEDLERIRKLLEGDAVHSAMHAVAAMAKAGASPGLAVIGGVAAAAAAVAASDGRVTRQRVFDLFDLFVMQAKWFFDHPNHEGNPDVPIPDSIKPQSIH
jgi:hypothetical protein